MTEKTVPTTNTLIVQFNDIVSRGYQTTELEIQSLKNQAKNFIEGEMAPTHSILGLLAAFEGDLETMRFHHETALKLLPHKQNYIMSLQKMGFFSEALLCSKELLLDTSSDAISLVVMNALYCCRFHEAQHYLSPRLKNSKVFPHFKTIEEGISIFERVGLQDDEAEQLQKIVYDLLHNKGIYRLSPQIDVSESTRVSYQIGIDRPISNIVDLNLELAENISKIDDMREEVIIFEYIYQ